MAAYRKYAAIILFQQVGTQKVIYIIPYHGALSFIRKQYQKQHYDGSSHNFQLIFDKDRNLFRDYLYF